MPKHVYHRHALWNGLVKNQNINLTISTQQQPLQQIICSTNLILRYDKETHQSTLPPSKFGLQICRLKQVSFIDRKVL